LAALLAWLVLAVGPALTFHYATVVWVAAVIAAAGLITIGTLIAYPYEMRAIVTMAGGRLVATHYGLYQTIAGLAIAAGTAVTGRALDAASAAGHPALPWWGLAAAAAACAAGLYLLARTPKDRATAAPDDVAVRPLPEPARH